MKIQIDVGEYPLSAISTLAATHGFKRKNPNRAWDSREYREAARFIAEKLYKDELTPLGIGGHSIPKGGWPADAVGDAFLKHHDARQVRLVAAKVRLEELHEHHIRTDCYSIKGDGIATDGKPECDYAIDCVDNQQLHQYLATKPNGLVNVINNPYNVTKNENEAQWCLTRLRFKLISQEECTTSSRIVGSTTGTASTKE